MPALAGERNTFMLLFIVSILDELELSSLVMMKGVSDIRLF